jgi:hypothetical protein
MSNLEYDIDTSLGIRRSLKAIREESNRHEPDQTGNLRVSVSPEPVVSGTFLVLDASILEF